MYMCIYKCICVYTNEHIYVYIYIHIYIRRRCARDAGGHGQDPLEADVGGPGYVLARGPEALARGRASRPGRRRPRLQGRRGSRGATRRAGSVSLARLGALLRVRPISLLRLRLLRLLDSNFPGNALCAWEFHPLNLRLRSCLSQTL